VAVLKSSHKKLAAVLDGNNVRIGQPRQ